MFNVEMYALLNPDLKRAGITTPVQLQSHYNKRGKREHRPITFHQKFPHFDHAQYQKNYPDLEGLNQYELEQHWLRHGIRQHRTYKQIQDPLNDKIRQIKESPHVKIFTDIYQREAWGKGQHQEFRGSPGPNSHLDYTIGSFIPFLRKLITVNNITSVVDLGCGLFEWSAPIYENLNVSYKGYDAYQDIIEYNKQKFPEKEFFHGDILLQRKKLPKADLGILKDVLVHWSNEDITTLLDYLVKEKVYKYILLVNTCRQSKDDVDTKTGGFRDLSCDYLPLKKYPIQKIYTYINKEVSMIFPY